MNRNLSSVLALAAVAAAAAAATAALVLPRTAYADDITIDPTPFVSTRTRADVRSELLGRADILRHQSSEWALQSNEPTAFKSPFTPQQAREEYRASRVQVNALNGEDSGSAYFKMSPLRVNPATSMGAPAR
jgi:hypothetical protein